MKRSFAAIARDVLHWASEYRRKSLLIAGDAVAAFSRNGDFTAAASLAFAATLALIPALFLLTTIVGFAVGSSQEALRRSQELLEQVIPAYSSRILQEVGFITAHTKTIGIVNGIVLLWAITPLVAELRTVMGRIFRKRIRRSFLIEKLIDAAITVLLVVAVTVLAVSGLLLRLEEQLSLVRLLPRAFTGGLPVLFVAAAILLLYLLFARRVPAKRLLAGAAVSAALWFLMRPAFTFLITYNPGYGFAFGSFKSLFVVIIWIYYSFVVFLIGAEVAASIGRREVVAVRRLMEGGRGIPASVARRFLLTPAPGEVIFSEGDRGAEMYAVRKGTVTIRRRGRDIAVIGPGGTFGEMALLLNEPRTATALAGEDAELIVISESTLSLLLSEYPDVVLRLLRDMAVRLRDTNRLIG